MDIDKFEKNVIFGYKSIFDIDEVNIAYKIDVPCVNNTDIKIYNVVINIKYKYREWEISNFINNKLGLIDYNAVLSDLSIINKGKRSYEKTNYKKQLSDVITEVKDIIDRDGGKFDPTEKVPNDPELVPCND
jgi:hypothetical protein